MFNGTLFEAQKPAAEFLCNKRSAGLFWEQGTGKTVISIAAAEKLFELGKAKNALILVPSSFAWQWGDKLREFSTTPFTVVRREDKQARQYSLSRANGGCYCVLPYSLFRRDFASVFRVSWDIVIADEAQEFRTYTSKTHKLMLGLNRKCSPTYRWALTGTVIANKLEELYAVFQWIDKKFLPPWPVYAKQHIVRNELGFISGYKNLKSLNKHLQAKMNRKTHADLKGQMPTLVEQIIKVPQTAAYRKAEAKLLKLLDSMAADLRFDSNGDLVSDGPKGPISRAFKEVREALQTAKHGYAIEQCNGILHENLSNKLVVFSGHKRPLYQLGEHYESLATYFTGDINADQKQHNIQQLASGGARILLSSNAGKAGLDLPFVNYAMHLDIPPSWEILDQRNKRITRASSTFDHAVVVYLVMEGSIEEFYLDVVRNKGRLANAATEGTEDEVVMRPTSLRKFIRND